MISPKPPHHPLVGGHKNDHQPTGNNGACSQARRYKLSALYSETERSDLLEGERPHAKQKPRFLFGYGKSFKAAAPVNDEIAEFIYKRDRKRVTFK